MTLNRSASLWTAVAVNVAKLTLLAALAPPVIAGIAQRASVLGDGFDTAAIVATTVSAGSVSAIAGALFLGFLADTGSASVRSRWAWTTVATFVGTAGLILLSVSDSRATLIVGWMLAQAGYSGAMTVLRVILADALPEHRRRGAAIVVLGSYGGLVLPLVMLLLFPSRLWETTFGLAVLSLAVPIVMVTLLRKLTRVPCESDKETEPQHRSQSALLSPPWILAIQFAANIIVTVFLSYHPLELAERTGTEVPVQSAVMIVTCAVFGIALSTGTLIWKPALLSHSVRLIAVAGLLLGGSLMLRAMVESLGMMLFAAFCSGVAVGLNSSALFAAALDRARTAHGGKLMGAYSAAGAAGQVVGPMIALGILYVLAPFASGSGYRALFLTIAVIPIAWSGLIFIARVKPHERIHSE